jgi:hypothetical protein
VALLFNAGGLNFRFFKVLSLFFKALSLSLQCQRGETAVLMTISRNNSNLLNWTSCVVMEQKWYANTVMPIFPLLMEAEATSTNMYVARYIRILKRLWLQLKTSARLW